MEGTLEIRKKPQTLLTFEKFHKRYFVLNEGILKFLESQGGKCIGQIHLGISAVYIDPENINQFLINTGSQVYEVRSDNQKLLKKWINSM